MLRSLLSQNFARAGLRQLHAGAAQLAAPAPVKTLKMFVDGKEVEVDTSYTVLQACAVAGVEIPRFCFHERLSIAGNCRMCLVEVEKSPKPIASCAMPVAPGMKVFTNSEKTKKAREGVMEFLLANHPLDCPICDQGGECDLQDQAMVFGKDRSRFHEYKRAVEDKNLGPLVKTVMTRCIHCTRCVRFAAEIAGVEDIGMTGRGSESQIGTYVEKMFDSELSGNIIDLCPVGALTSKPYAFTARSWELQRVESIDVMDAVGANVSIDTRIGEVMRVLPRVNDDVNEEWLADKSRFAYDGLKRQRLHTPLVKIGGRLTAVTWREALEYVRDRLRVIPASNIYGLAGSLADAESMIALKDLLNRLGSENVECREDGMRVDPGLRSNYLTNTGLRGAEEADVVLLVGCNPRVEAPLFNTRLRKAFLYNDAVIASIGPKASLTYQTHHLGNTVGVLRDIVAGKHPLSDIFAQAKRPMVVIGSAALRRSDSDSIQSLVAQLAGRVPSLVQPGVWNGINVLHTAASRVGALDLGLVPGAGATTPSKGPRAVYLLNADDFAPLAPETFVIYQGHHGDKGASAADVVLPGSAYTEKDATYVNTEGRVQRTKRAVGPPGDAREDWKIIRALSDVMGVRLPYDTVSQVRERLADVAPHFALLDQVQAPSVLPVLQSAAIALDSSTPLASGLVNYYMTDPISRASVTMAKCTQSGPATLVRARKQASYADAVTEDVAAISAGAAAAGAKSAGAAQARV